MCNSLGNHGGGRGVPNDPVRPRVKNILLSAYFLGQLTGFFGIIANLVVEHREVEGQTQLDGMSALQLRTFLTGFLVGRFRIVYIFWNGNN